MGFVLRVECCCVRQASRRHRACVLMRPWACGTDCMQRAMQQAAVLCVGEGKEEISALMVCVWFQYKERQRKARCAVERRWPVYQLMRTLTHWALTGRYSGGVRLSKAVRGRASALSPLCLAIGGSTARRVDITANADCDVNGDERVPPLPPTLSRIKVQVTTADNDEPAGELLQPGRI